MKILSNITFSINLQLPKQVLTSAPRRRLGEQQEELFRKFFRSQTEMYNVLSTELRNGNGKRPFPSGSSTEDDIDKYHDQDLVAWLRFNQFPDETIRKIIREEFTLTDFNKSVTKEDLRDIGLK